MLVLLRLHTFHFFQKENRLIYMIAGSIIIMMIFNIILDYCFTAFQNSAFYFSESFLFSSHWILYFPLLLLILKKGTDNLGLKLVFTALAILTHQFAYPALIWFLSKVFYAHTFDYWQTFNFGLSSYLIKSILIYGFFFLAFNFLHKKTNQLQITDETADETRPKIFINSIIISDNNNIKSIMPVNDIFYISANTPYVDIHGDLKKHLHYGTLKSLENQLDGSQFIRIHKSYIINLQKIASYKSRQNGDYDVVLSNKTKSVLRVSRNYAKDFKSMIKQHTHLTIK